MDNTTPKRTVTVEEAARLLGISRTTAYDCVHRGEIRSIRLGRRILIPLNVIDELLASATMR
ncbi:MAG: helix-turn-helix domain-containing protein [Acidimicrobiia bacterium]